jgi:CRISPR-associated protein Cas2
MKGVADYAVVYDISEDNERRRVDEILRGFGFRIQKSVFECRLTKRTKEDLVKELNSADIRTGFIKIYRLEHSWKNCTIGAKKQDPEDDGNVFIV